MTRQCKHTLRIFWWQLQSMPEYSTTLPSGTTLFKMWKRNVNDSWLLQQAGRPRAEPLWVVGQYHPIELPGEVGIRWFDLQMLEGPEPPEWRAPDWANTARWEREFDAERLKRPPPREAAVAVKAKEAR